MIVEFIKLSYKRGLAADFPILIDFTIPLIINKAI